MNRDSLEQLFGPLLDEEKKELLYKYYELLIETNKYLNLTTITSLDDVYIKHFYDSMLTSKIYPLNDLNTLTLVDIGSGAGFPGLVLKILFPNLDVTLVEPTKKRCNFLEQVITTLQLKMVKVINDRIENYVNTVREHFDLGIARAVSPLNILLELAIPVIKVNGYFIAMKGSNYQEEVKEASQALKLLNTTIIKETSFILPLEKGARTILLIKKNKVTPNIYPRLYAKIKKQPL